MTPNPSDRLEPGARSCHIGDVENRLAVKVYYEDTDALGVVYYANYLKYFERGRTELLADLGKSVREWNEDGYNFVVVKVTIKFHQPGKLGDVCEVHTKITPGSDYKLKMHQRLYRSDELLTEADVQIACLDGDLMIRELPEQLVVWDDD